MEQSEILPAATVREWAAACGGPAVPTQPEAVAGDRSLEAESLRRLFSAIDEINAGLERNAKERGSASTEVHILFLTAEHWGRLLRLLNDAGYFCLYKDRYRDLYVPALETDILHRMGADLLIQPKTAPQ